MNLVISSTYIGPDRRLHQRRIASAPHTPERRIADRRTGKRQRGALVASAAIGSLYPVANFVRILSDLWDRFGGE